jgi:phosphomannomutase
MAERRCPGEKGIVDEAICRGRQTRKYHKCAECEWRDESLQSRSARVEDDPRHKVFKAYDIRGVYPDQLDEKLAEMVGMAAARFLNGGSLIVSRDMRSSSESLARSLIQGVLTTGCNVLDIGMASTDANYFAIAKYRQSGGIQVTASHNPPEYNGFKISREQAIPMSYDTGLANIERIALGPPMRPSETRGQVEPKDIMADWKRHVLSFVRRIMPLNVVIDAGNGMAGKMLPPILAELPLKVTELYFKPDGTFPNHEANPLKEENIADLKKKVLETGADLGVAFDGDADRCIFVDENGLAVSSDFITALFADHLLPMNPKAAVIYDVRSSRVVPEEIRKHGGIPVRERVGHSYIKATMRQRDALFGGELSGHFYWRANYNCDSGAITMVELLNILSSERRSLSELLKPLRRYFATGEVNFDVEDKEGKIAELAATFKDGRQDTLDGLSVDYDDWWFNVRPSNTEPTLRLNLEASTQALMEEKRDAVAAILRK